MLLMFSCHLSFVSDASFAMNWPAVGCGRLAAAHWTLLSAQSEERRPGVLLSERSEPDSEAAPPGEEADLFTGA